VSKALVKDCFSSDDDGSTITDDLFDGVLVTIVDEDVIFPEVTTVEVD
jgi:hypothetical protein